MNDEHWMLAVLIVAGIYFMCALSFATGYGDSEPRFPKLSFSRAMLAGLLWPLLILCICGDRFRELEIRDSNIRSDSTTEEP